jgi:hypothetical protein
LSDNGPRYDHSLRTAARIISLHLHSDEPTPVILGKLTFLILDSMYAAERELNDAAFSRSKREFNEEAASGF